MAGAQRNDVSKAHLNARALVGMRWAALAGQLTGIGVAIGLFDMRLPVVALASVLAFEAAFNLAMRLLNGRGLARGAAALGGGMVVDLLVLTALLYLSGGPMNPFSFLYVVHIALAAVILPPRWTVGIGAASVLCYGMLFFAHRPIVLDPGTDSMHWHLQGMWVAFVVAASFITLFVGRLARALEQQERALRDARERAHRSEKLSALATLTAGAAHELATPLSTIAVVVKDLEIDAQAEANPDQLLEDTRLIRAQVERCRGILEQLAADTGQALGGDIQPVSLETLVARAKSAVAESARIDVFLPEHLRELALAVPEKPLLHALHALLHNALQASAQRQRISLQLFLRGERLCFEVRDRGVGMPEEVRRRATEPFFSTKQHSSRMGLGLFLAESVADGLGGALHLQPADDVGTRATLELPLDIATQTSRSQPALEAVS